VKDRGDGVGEPEVEALLRRHYRRLDPGPAPARLVASVRARLSGRAEHPEGAPVGRIPVAPVRVFAHGSRVQVGPSLALAAAVVLLAVTGFAVSRLSGQPAQASPSMPATASGSGVISSPVGGSPQASVQPAGTTPPGPAVAGSTQSAMAFSDRSHGIVVGAYEGRGAVWTTADEGQDWTAVPVDAPPLDSVTMLGTKAWASASCSGDPTGTCQPTVLESSDGGATWAAIASTAVTSLSFVDAQDGFGIGPSSPAPQHLLATTDGGATWAAAPGPAPCETGFFPVAVSFADAQQGWVACGSGKAALGSSPKEFVATLDGGATWVVRSRADGGVAAGDSLPFSGTFRGIDMLSSGTGVAWLATDGLIRTTDGGATWARLPLGDAGGSLEWPGAAITADGMLFALTVDVSSSDTSAVFNLGLDDGRTWKPYTQFGRLPAPGASPTPQPPAAVQPATPDAVAFKDATHGIAVGSDATTAYVWRSSDAGSTWSVEPLGAGALTTLAVAGPSAWTDLLVCPADAAPGNPTCTGSIERSDDGGATWTLVGHANLTSLSFGDATHGFGVGPEPPSANAGTSGGLGTAIYATVDAGATWTPLADSRPCGRFDPVSVSFVSASHGWVGCSSVIGAGSGLKGVMETTDGGRTWSWRARIDYPGGLTAIGTITSSDYLQTIAMAADGSGFITGQRGSTIRTSDGGRIWTSCPPGQFDAFSTSGAAILPSGPWYVVQSGWLNASLTRTESRLMRSTDRGASWSQVGGWLPSP
jgi:photosystem II stability/assembly factor-like uncharacterized protein